MKVLQRPNKRLRFLVEHRLPPGRNTNLVDVHGRFSDAGKLVWIELHVRLDDVKRLREAGC